MKKIFTAAALAVTLGVAALATSSPADAWWRGGWGWGWRGCCWGPGPWVAGAVVGGAAVGAAVAASRPYYYGGYYYPYGPNPYYGPGCRRVWNGYYWVRACY
jgi:hypothetical protein